MFDKIIALIRDFDTIIIHRHFSPDGDALGSQTGLYGLIRDNFPEKAVYRVGDPAGRYSFMERSVMDDIPDEYFDGALSIILDCATEELVSDNRFRLASKTARIDHHIYCETFTDEEVIDTSFESCAGMIAFFAMEQNLAVSEKTAAALFTGIVTDSGRFRYDSTSSKTFEIASFLMRSGIDTESIYRSLYCDDLRSVKLRAHFMSKIKIYKDSPVAYIYTTKEELDGLGVENPAQISRGRGGVMSDIRGVDIWVNFTEDGEKALCELRASKYNINPVAVKYGGGGHKKASGADVADYDEAVKMLDDLVEITQNEAR